MPVWGMGRTWGGAAMALTSGIAELLIHSWVPSRLLPGLGSFSSNRKCFFAFFFFFFPVLLPCSLQMKNKERLAVAVRYSLQAFQNWIWCSLWFAASSLTWIHLQSRNAWAAMAWAQGKPKAVLIPAWCCCSAVSQSWPGSPRRAGAPDHLAPLSKLPVPPHLPSSLAILQGRPQQDPAAAGCRTGAEPAWSYSPWKSGFYTVPVLFPSF